MSAISDAEIHRGRGAGISPQGRFARTHSETFDDGWDIPEEVSPLKTQVLADESRTILAKNESPDIPFSVSINAYRGCEHGCIYCFARPNHAYRGLSPGLDFETKIFVKPSAAALLEKELRKKDYSPKPVALGANTDPYQPVERQLGITRAVLEVLERFGHPVTIVTKSALVLRDGC